MMAAKRQRGKADENAATEEKIRRKGRGASKIIETRAEWPGIAPTTMSARDQTDMMPA